MDETPQSDSSSKVCEYSFSQPEDWWTKEFHYLPPHTQSTILVDKCSGTHAQKRMRDGDKERNKKYIGVIGI